MLEKIFITSFHFWFKYDKLIKKIKRRQAMSLKIIYGKSGSGKSTYVFNEIASKIQNNTSKKIYIITPEQFSFTAEKKLLDAVSTSAVISAEVLTFNRMAYRVMKEIRKCKNKKLISIW